MKTYQVVLYDQDEEFVLALMNYLNRSAQIPLLSMAFTSGEELFDYLAVHRVDLIVMETQLDVSKGTLNQETPVLRMYGSDEKTGKDEGNYIFKYSKASDYLRCILRILSEERQVLVADGRGWCMAVYSPIGRSGKTILAKALCRYVQKQEEKPVQSIYIGFEEYGVLGNENYGMEELLYYIKQRADNISMKMKALSGKEDGYDVIPSACSYAELKSLCSDDVNWVLQSVRREGIYDYLIADIGGASLMGIDMLTGFDEVYLPCLRDSDSEKKWNSFCNYLKRLKLKEDLLRHWYPVYVPKDGMTDEKLLTIMQRRESGQLENLAF